MTQTAQSGLTELIANELSSFHRAKGNGRIDDAWTALKRAHILSQPLWRAHLHVHAAMLGFAVDQRDLSEVLGQVFRLALAPLGNATGRLPHGNNGRANVSAFLPMPIPADLIGAFADDRRKNS